MKALISTIQVCGTGYRVAQIASDDQIFPVAEAFFWVDCADTDKADQCWYDPTDKTIKPFDITEV